MSVAALYVHADGVYASLGCDVWDEARDARLYDGPGPVVAHPPCACWGRYAWAAKQDTRDCGVRAVQQVRAWRGVLEHPAHSKLWPACGLPAPGELPDAFGGRTLALDQGRFGHAAPKPTWLYFVGLPAPTVPAPLLVAPEGRIERMSRRQREATPEAFARWLVAWVAS